MSEPKTPLLKTALIYDFDGTLARGNMQEVSFIPSVGMDVGAFWGEAEALTKDADGDGILMYMQLMLHHARQNGAPVTRETLRRHGEAVALGCAMAFRFSARQGLCLAADAVKAEANRV